MGLHITGLNFMIIFTAVIKQTNCSLRAGFCRKPEVNTGFWQKYKSQSCDSRALQMPINAAWLPSAQNAIKRPWRTMLELQNGLLVVLGRSTETSNRHQTTGYKLGLFWPGQNVKFY